MPRFLAALISSDHLHQPWRSKPGSSWLLLLAVLAAFGCAACRTPGPQGPSPRPLGGLVVRCQPTDALIYVDERYWGSAELTAKHPLRLAPGLHRVEIRRDGHFSHFLEVRIEQGVRQQLEVKLRPEPY